MKKRTIYLLGLILTLVVISMAFVQPEKKKNVKSNKENKAIEAVEENLNLVWTDDVMKADSISKKTKKPIFGFFTGSDWCGWCHKLQREVFAKKEFKVWANKNVVLLELDFPRAKALPDNIKQQNAQLAQAFQVRGYPTVWLFTIERDSVNTQNVRLNALGSLGYPSGAVQGKEEVKFLETANEILASKK